ncbi:hypothetical protein EJ02DRAFT_340895 [Clathrospora elynae]|uniref:DNA-directed RNA polymerase I subunit RPA43 n=1 Tax=Clathrospora elynae TaxID=706981 RepID=A0A6A5SXK0_9PLEO|nr:hypothetical protein EJ02DRAFT_340895 [Clathrospora elynae]
MAPAQSEEHSLFHIERISQYVSLSPASLNQPFPALCASIFSPLLLSYFPPARGIVLEYSDVQLSDKPPPSAQAAKSSRKRSRSQQQDDADNSAPVEPLLLKHVDEYFAPFLWATASLLVWRPARNAYLQGRITHQSKTHITLAHLNTFPVSILKEYLPADWSWHSQETGKLKKGWDGRLSDEGGWWVNGDEKVEGDLTVRIRDFDGRFDGKGRGKGFLRVEGSLLSEEEEKAKRGGKGKQKAITGVLRTQQQREQARGEVIEID